MENGLGQSRYIGVSTLPLCNSVTLANHLIHQNLCFLICTFRSMENKRKSFMMYRKNLKLSVLLQMQSQTLSLFYLFIYYYYFLVVLGLRFCARAFSSCGERGPLFIAVRGPLTVAASLVADHKLQTRRLSSCGSRAQLLRGTWDLPRPELERMFPALAGRLSTTAPPGKP